MTLWVRGTECFLDEQDPLPDGPLRENDISKVSTKGAELVEGFEWDTIDLTNDSQVGSFYFPGPSHQAVLRELMNAVDPRGI